MTRFECIRFFAGELIRSGMEEHEAETEARLALSTVLDCTISDLLLKGYSELSDSVVYKLEKMLPRRLNGEPLDYILGEKWFMGMRLSVTPDVLIPRRETEILAENAIQIAALRLTGSVLDLCTGSGCIACSLAKYTLAAVTAADISLRALEVAKKNASGLHLNIDFRHSDLFSDIPESFDMICSNPPYIPSGEISGLMREVRDFEPRLALDAGADGLRFYRLIAKQAPTHLNDGGVLLLEIGCEQGNAVKQLLESEGFNGIRIMKDYSGLDRVVIAYK